ncbi:cytochrome c oxidase subunit VIIc-domain-containing protein [Dipodascopsis tothii]|uniref:cytochrome c oxidase subunit VIIc-domain-containing protein n=1 Tax=Dipodascopsis tothii TaxID=44089 RepID=UPI0034CE005D
MSAPASRFVSRFAMTAGRQAGVRGFSSSAIARGAHFEEGVYSNIPFKVKNRKIPFAIPYFTFFLVPFLTPFGMAWWALNK